MTQNAVRVGVTGLEWLGGGTGSAENLVREVVLRAHHEILMTIYSITTGGNDVLTWIESRVAAGVKVIILVNHLDSQAGRHLLLDLADNAAGRVEIYDHRASAPLHAKCLVVDRLSAVVGSANLSFYGMVASHELVLAVDGPAASEIGSLIDRLRLSPLTTRVR